MALRSLALTVMLAGAVATPVSAKESLGVFGQWGVFRDAQVPRCYSIATAEPARSNADRAERSGFASIGTWPSRQVRGQVHFRLSRTLAQRPGLRLVVAGRRFNLTGGGSEAWAQDAGMDAAILAAMRAAGSMQISATDTRGRRFTDRYSLDGAATAMDAATIGCSSRR